MALAACGYTWDAAKFALYAENNFMVESGEISILTMM
jgi:hypothetical protein